MLIQRLRFSIIAGGINKMKGGEHHGKVCLPGLWVHL